MILLKNLFSDSFEKNYKIYSVIGPCSSICFVGATNRYLEKLTSEFKNWVKFWFLKGADVGVMTHDDIQLMYQQGQGQNRFKNFFVERFSTFQNLNKNLELKSYGFEN